MSAKYKDNVEDVQFVVVEPEVESVLSGNICVKLSLLKRVHQLTSNTPLARTTLKLDDYPELFNGLGCLPGMYRAELADGAPPVYRASGRLLKKKSNFAGFSGTNSRENNQFCGNFRGQFRRKMIGKKRPISWELPKQMSLESNWFCADLRNVFNETRRSYSIYSGFIPQYEIVLYK